MLQTSVAKVFFLLLFLSAGFACQTSKVNTSSSSTTTTAIEEPVLIDIIEATVELTDENFKKEILDEGEVSLVYFWATWCGPCKITGPIVEELAHDYAGKAKVGKFNIDYASSVAKQLGIRSIPAMVFMKNGQAIDRIVGTTQKHVLAAKLDQYMN